MQRAKWFKPTFVQSTPPGNAFGVQGNQTVERFQVQLKTNAGFETPNVVAMTNASPTTPAPWLKGIGHEVTIDFEPTLATEGRILQDALGGTQNHPKEMFANEIQFFGKELLTAQVQRTKKYFHDANGNVIKIVTYKDGEIEGEEDFGYTYDNRMTAYAKTKSDGNVEKLFLYSFTGCRQKNCVKSLCGFHGSTP